MSAFRDRHRLAGAIAWCAVGVWGLWAAVRLLGLELGFPLVTVIAFTPYAAATAVVPLALALALRRWAAASVAAVVLVTLFAIVLPRAVSNSTAAPAGTTPTRVMTANLLAGRADPEAIVELVRQRSIDILSLQELTPSAVAALRDAGLERLLRHHALAASNGVLGTGIYADRPLVDRSPHGLAPGGTYQAVARARIEGGDVIEVVAVHPLPPTDAPATATWRSGLRALPPGEPADPPRLLLGDFNATLDHAELRAVLDRGYRDAADATGDGLVPTWPSDFFPPPVTIDHILVDKRFRIADVSVDDLPGSDHRAVSATLFFR